MMWKYNCKKRNQYYDSAIRLYIHEKDGRVEDFENYSGLRVDNFKMDS